MDTKICLHLEKGIGPSDYERVIDQLRVAAAGRGQSEDHRQRIRAATQC